MSKAEELFYSYALFHELVKDAEKEVREATAAMGKWEQDASGNIVFVRKFICLKEAHGRPEANFNADGSPVTDEDDLRVIARWRKALHWRKSARRAFADVKRSILAAGRKERKKVQKDAITFV